ncbi:MAG: bifunctional phosphoribosylaminoimidazolecarboxamide formyltransferase/IMP cyclohydrolase, partial [Bacteroidales bacterium]|nr:bifunctional phosphoribosylaminoimidazolecarboxamide formyltransferase/IMP cyclohydrolase [Bacteroidales bacterium]
MKEGLKKIESALISVYYKEGIDEIASELCSKGVKLYSTGGTYTYLAEKGFEVEKVEDVTGYPSILGGRVKTLHPKIFGGILARRENETDRSQMQEYQLPYIDLVIVDLYPFEEYVAAGASHQEIIEKIDIGGISLIRAAAKNYKDVVIVPSRDTYAKLLAVLREQDCATTLADRLSFAKHAFAVSSHYDTAIFNYLNSDDEIDLFAFNSSEAHPLRYGENPHQNASYFGDSLSLPVQLHGKEISYNNLLDIEAAIELIGDFSDPTVAIIKHNNACGCAVRSNILDAWKDALEADPVSAFGGIIIANRGIGAAEAEEINKIFFEVIIAPEYTQEALDILEVKKNRIILVNTGIAPSQKKFRSLLGGVLVQERDTVAETEADLTVVTTKAPLQSQIADLLFANRMVKHSKSNAIVLAK